MKNQEKIIYSIDAEDVQQVADEILDRKLNEEELEIIENEIGGYIDWYQAIQDVIMQKITFRK